MNKLMNITNEENARTFKQCKLEIDISNAIDNIIKENPGYSIERVDTHYEVKSCKFYIYYTLVKEVRIA